DALAKDFIKNKLDIKHLVRTICNSRTYQLSSVPNEFNKHDKQNHARYYGRRLMAEVFHDIVDQACGTRTQFSRMSKQARAVDLPHENFSSYFLDVFSRPQRSSACECDSNRAASLTQVLHLSISPEVENKVSSGNGRVAKLVTAKTAPDRAIEELYLAAMSRFPTAEERQRTNEYLSRQTDLRRGLEDVLWVLINSKEFMFNH
ncbi:MAG TPA: DUF1553 domain-containing protein, partial [Gemmataceae bacterium]|nr:DUF1553 domain-containing protein [Gemmataceae bacterium]